MPAHTPNTSIVRINARAAADERGVLASPAALTLRVTDPQSPGPPGQCARIELLSLSTPTDSPSPDLVISRPDAVLLPALVNAHAHLDLTHIGPRPHAPDDGFVAWVDMIRAARATEDADILASVRIGIDLSIRGGSAALGDIAGAPAGVPNIMPFKALRESPVAGVSYLEFFAIGLAETGAIERVGAALDALEREEELPQPGDAARLGLQPHATNTVARSAYLWAASRARELGLPLCTHAAETPEELEFIASGAGPQRDMLERFGIWDDSIDVGHGEHPIAHLAPFLAACRGMSPPPMLVHVNDAGGQIEALAASGANVAYCPRASAYFDAPGRLGPHPYRQMLDAGVNVCLGTDSIVCLPPEHASGPNARLSVLDEMRVLHARDGADAAMLLSMGTTRGARALGLDESAFRLDPGPIAGLLAVPTGGSDPDPLNSALGGSEAPEFLYMRNHACQTR